MFYKRHRLGRRKEQNGNWSGGVTHARGYVQERAPEHPRANRKGYVFQHILVVERALGRFLRYPEEVHHWNHIRTDNRPENLLVCPNRAYHFLIEQRERALDACGHPGWRKCQFCKEYDDPKNVRVNARGTAACHPECDRRYQRELKKGKREAA